MGGEKLNPRRFMFRAALWAVIIIFIQFPAYSQSEEEPFSQILEEAPPSNPEDSIILGEAPLEDVAGGGASVGLILRMVLVLALAALAIYGVVFFIKRLARPPRFRDPHLKVLASVPLGGDSFAAVVSVGAKAWLVGGGSGGGVSLISEIDEPEALESMLLDEAQRNAETGANRFPDFRSFLNRLGRRSPETGAGMGGHADSLRKQRDRLKGL